MKKQNVFSKGVFVTRTARGQMGKGTFGPMKIFLKNVWIEETGNLPLRGR